MATVLSGCVHCRQLLCRGRAGDPWRALPARGQVLYPGAAIACPARPARLPHQSPADAGEPA
jgi:hypothetical protein